MFLGGHRDSCLRHAMHRPWRCVYEWDVDNLRKIKAHGITALVVEQALSIRPILIYEHEADGEPLFVYYGETARLRLLAVVFTERGEKIRVITATTWNDV